MFCIVVLRVVSLLLVCVILFGFCVCCSNGFYMCLVCVIVFGVTMLVVLVVCVWVYLCCFVFGLLSVLLVLFVVSCLCYVCDVSI